MRSYSANSTVGNVRTPESLLIDSERARFRDEVLTQALASIESEFLRLLLYARFTLGWGYQQIADEFGIGLATAFRDEARALDLIRRQLAARNVKALSDIL